MNRHLGWYDPPSVRAGLALRLRRGKKNRTEPRLHEFVGQDAQAVDRSRFNAEDNRSERNWQTAMRFRKRKLSRREIAFRPHQHQNTFRPISVLVGIIAEKFFKVNRVGLE